MKELKAIARKIGVKNYESLSRIELVKEIDKLEPPKESKKKNITSSLLLKGKKILNLSLKKKSNLKKMFTKQKRFIVHLMIVMLNIKIIVMEINQYQLKDI